MNSERIPKKQKVNTGRAYSMRFRFLATVIFAMLAISIFVGGVSIYEVDNYILTQAKNYIQVTCTNESSQVDNSLRNMEKSVKIMESYLMDFFPNAEVLDDPDVLDAAIKSADQMFVDVAVHTSTSGAISYYFRLDPAISNSKAGLFYSKLNGGSEFISLEPTDLSIYAKDDTEHVGWFWQPYEAGKPIWMKPYYNQNNKVLMISYVMPMYVEGRFIGVVGMDFDYKALDNQVHSIEIYENGFAHLEIDGEVVCDDACELRAVTDAHSEDYMHISKNLVNGMDLVISASYDDIRQVRYDISLEIFFVVLILAVLFTVIVVFVVKRIVEPLKKLTDASAKLSNGDYDVEIDQSNTLEINVLSTAFENMAMRLREREALLQHSANRDSMTGLRNTTSYTVWMDEFNEEIRNKDIDFGVVMLDLNDLKATNDKYGHDVGNQMIVTAAKVISDVFENSPVFRIGGDEFVVVLKDEDLVNREELFKQFESKCASVFVNDNANIPVRIASGFARFDPDKDMTFTDVFKRADTTMYENKRKMKIEIA